MKPIYGSWVLVIAAILVMIPISVRRPRRSPD
jgi:hypothetical protein